MTTIRVRLIRSKGRLRIQSVADGKFVQCPTDWRESLRCGVAHDIHARLRADGACWVYYPSASAV